MNSKPVKAEDYYAANKAREKQYYYLMLVRNVTHNIAGKLIPSLLMEGLTPENEKLGQIARIPFQPEMKGVILTEKANIAFKYGRRSVPAGSLLYVNPHDKNGLSVARPSYALREFGNDTVPTWGKSSAKNSGPKPKN